ncbi:MAG: hypothetical protein P8X42_09435, partial [Calditrichaceae bacterium]
TLLKRNVPGETAKKYLQILRSNGLACHIEEGVHLQAVEEKTKTAPPQPEAVTQPPEPDVTTPPVKPPLTQDTTKNNAIFNFHYPDHGGLIKLLTLSFLLPDGIELDTTPDKMPPASIGQQILAAIATFSHMIFMYMIAQVIVGIVAGLIISFFDVEVPRNFIDTLGGLSGLLAMFAVIFFLPMMWRGHSFGQRAMGILHIPVPGGDPADLIGPSLLMHKLTFRTKSTSVSSLTLKPWKSILIPFASAIVFHFVVAIPLAGILAFGHSGKTRSSGNKFETSKAKTAALSAFARSTLRQIHAGISMYIAETARMSEPLNRPVFRKIAIQYLQSGTANDMLNKIDNGSMKLQGNLSDYKIGLLENGVWIVLDQNGTISEQEHF